MIVRSSLVALLVGVVVCGCGDDDSGGTQPAPSSSASGPMGGPNFDDDDNPSGDDDDNPFGDDEDETAVDPLPPAELPEPPTTTTCGQSECRDVLVGDIVVAPCCPAGAEDRCGLDLSAVSEFMPLQGECVELEQPGEEDESCPSVLFADVVEMRELPGCCMPEGLCGVVANFSLLADFGCVDPRTLLLGGDEPGAENEPEAMMTDVEFDAQAPTLDAATGNSTASGDSDSAMDGDAGSVVLGDGGALLVLAQQQGGLRSCTPAAVPEPEPQPETDASGGAVDGGNPPSAAVDASTGPDSDAATGAMTGTTRDETSEPSDAATPSTDGG
jgi:hypothetical protein